MKTAAVEAKIRAPWTPDEVKRLEESHLVLPLGGQQQLDYHDKARSTVDGRHRALTNAARSRADHVRRKLGLPQEGGLQVERRTMGPCWRDKSGAKRTGYGVVCGAVEVWIGGTVREAELALTLGVSS